MQVAWSQMAAELGLILVWGLLRAFSTGLVTNRFRRARLAATLAFTQPNGMSSSFFLVFECCGPLVAETFQNLLKSNRIVVLLG